MTDDLQLSGKVALVTGGDRGIGRAIALRLAAMGADVAITYRKREAEAAEVVRLIRSLGRRSISLSLDLSSLDSVRGVVEAVRGSLGPISVLVNNAGVGFASPFSEVPRESLERQVNANLVGPFALTQEAIKDMIAARWGRVVFVSSVAGINGAEYLSAYSAAKAGLIGLARSLAAEVARYNVTVNVVAPGFVGTRLGLSYFEWLDGRSGRRQGESLQRYLERVPSHRLVTEEEVAAVVAFLASPEASGVSGQVIVVDAGASLGLGLG